MVLSFTMQDWKNLVEAYGMEDSQPMIPARKDHVYFDPLIEFTSATALEAAAMTDNDI